MNWRDKIVRNVKIQDLTPSLTPVRDEQTRSSDIDVVVEIEKGRKNIHSFMQLKRFLEKELSRRIDLGFEHSLKPIVKEKIKGQIIYV